MSDWGRLFTEWFLAELIKALEAEERTAAERHAVETPNVTGQATRSATGERVTTARQSNLLPRPGQPMIVFRSGREPFALGDGPRAPPMLRPPRGSVFVPPPTYPPFLPPPAKSAYPVHDDIQYSIDDGETWNVQPNVDSAPWWMEDHEGNPVVTEIPGLPRIIDSNGAQRTPYARDIPAGFGGARQMDTDLALVPGSGVVHPSSFEHPRNRLRHFLEARRWYRYFPLPFMAGVKDGRIYVRVPVIPMFWVGERSSDGMSAVYHDRNNFDQLLYVVHGDTENPVPTNFGPEFWMVANDAGDPPFPSTIDTPARYEIAGSGSVAAFPIVRVFEDGGAEEATGQTLPGRTQDVTDPEGTLLVVEDEPYDPNTMGATNPHRHIWFRLERSTVDGWVISQSWSYNVRAATSSGSSKSRSRAQTESRFHYLVDDSGDPLRWRRHQKYQNLYAAYLAGALLYEGEFGTLPAPHSGLSRVFAGITVNGGEFFTSEVILALGGTYGVVVQESGAVTISRADPGTTDFQIVWQGVEADFFHPSHLPDLSPWYPPLPTYAFIGQQWPQPTGEIWYRGAWFMLREREEQDRFFVWGEHEPPPVVAIPRYQDYIVKEAPASF